MTNKFDLNFKEYLLNKYAGDAENSEELSEIRLTKGEFNRIGDVLSESLYQLDKLLSIYKVVQSEKVDEVADLHHEIQYLKTLISAKHVELIKDALKEGR